MFVVCLLLFPVLLYNTEALPAANGEGYWNPYNTVWDTSIDTNASKIIAVETNYSYSVPPGVVDKTIIVPTSKFIPVYSGTTIKPTTDDGDEPTYHTETNDSYNVTTEREFSRNITTTPDSWYNRTDEVFEITTAEIPHDRYSGKVGSITLENGILTAHLPETGSAEEIPLTTVAVTTPKRPIDWWSYKYGTTTTTGRPYYNPYYGSYRQNTTTEDATTPKRPIDLWTYKYDTTTTRGRPYYNPYYGSYRQNITTEDATTPKRPIDWWTFINDTTTTTGRPYYNPYYGSYRPISATTPDSWHDKTTEVFETTTTGKPNDWFKLRAYFKNISTPNFWYNKTPEYSETTTAARSYNRHWPRRDYSRTTTPTSVYWHKYSPWYTTQELYGTDPRTTTVTPRPPYPTTTTVYYTWYPRTTTDAYTWYPTRTTDRYTYTWGPTTTPKTYQFSTTDTTDQANRTTPATTCKSCSPENISNSTINTNDRGNYGKLIDLLKRIAENILPSTMSIAPNLNVTHLTVASGNGNMFLYVNN